MLQQEKVEEEGQLEDEGKVYKGSQGKKGKFK